MTAPIGKPTEIRKFRFMIKKQEHTRNGMLFLYSIVPNMPLARLAQVCSCKTLHWSVLQAALLQVTTFIVACIWQCKPQGKTLPCRVFPSFVGSRRQNSPFFGAPYGKGISMSADIDQPTRLDCANARRWIQICVAVIYRFYYRL